MADSDAVAPLYASPLSLVACRGKASRFENEMCKVTEPRNAHADHHQPEAKPSEVELARQREVAMAVVDRAAPLFKALANQWTSLTK